MELRRLVENAERVRRRGSRLAKIEAFSSLLAETPPEELPATVSILAGELPFGRIGVGWATVAESRGIEAASESCLTVAEVLETFRQIAETSGQGSKQRKVDLLGELLGKATEEEQDFLRRLLVGELRQGALEGIVLDAVSRTAGLPLDDLRRAAMLAGDFTEVARVALIEGAPGLSRFRVELFRPLRPMLAQPVEDVAEAVAELGAEGRAFALEHKIDGARVQVHREGDIVRVYSRSLREVTASVPEVVETVRGLACERVILDGEAFATTDEGRVQPFQTTMRRFGRKLDVERLRVELPLEVRFFDALLLDEAELLDLATEERWRALEGLVPKARRIPRLVTADAEAAAAFLGEALEAGHEGIMAKALDAPYAAGSRGKSWLKVKPAHTLDLVVLAAEWGSGRRRGTLSNLHLGARDERTGGFVMLGKTFKGLTDELLAWQTVQLLAREREREDHVVFVDPELVVEIAFNDIQASPHYPAGMALRFARVRGYREDKSPAEADTIETVRRIFEASQPAATREAE